MGAETMVVFTLGRQGHGAHVKAKRLGRPDVARPWESTWRVDSPGFLATYTGAQTGTVYARARDRGLQSVIKRGSRGLGTSIVAFPEATGFAVGLAVPFMGPWAIPVGLGIGVLGYASKPGSWGRGFAMGAAASAVTSLTLSHGSWVWPLLKAGHTAAGFVPGIGGAAVPFNVVNAILGR